MAPTGNDANPGSLTSPWATPYKAFRSTAPGDVVYFRGGDYVTKSMLSVAGGTSTAPIKYLAYPGEVPTIVYDRQTLVTDLTTFPIIYIGSSYVVIDGLQILQTETSRSFTGANNQRDTAISIFGNNVTIRNTVITNPSALGIFVRGANNLIEKNKISGNYSHAFYIAGLNGIFRDNELDCYRGYGNQQCIQIQYASSVGNKIYRNLIKNGQACGVVFSGMVSNNEVFNNIFINNGIKPPGEYGVVVSFWNEDGPIGSGNKFYNNTIMGKRPSSGLLAPTKGEIVEIYNNIFSMSEASPILGSSTYTKIANNIFYNVTGIVPAGNFMTNPLLANLAGVDANSAKIQAGSPAIDKGIAVSGLVDDYFHTLRPQGATNDIGAYEFTLESPPSTNHPAAPKNLRVF